MVIRSKFAFLLLFLGLASADILAATHQEDASEPRYRMWTDTKGRQVELALLGGGSKEKTLKFRNRAGKVFTVAIDTLSKADQEWLYYKASCPFRYVVWLQKDIKDPGINVPEKVLAFPGPPEGDRSKYERSSLSVEIDAILDWRKYCLEDGQKIMTKQWVTADGTYSVFIIDMKLDDGVVTSPVLDEIGKRFQLTVPMELSVWVEVRNKKVNMYIDVLGGKALKDGNN